MQPSIRTTDLRLLAPVPVRRVSLLGDLDSWRPGLEAVGVEVVDEGSDLVITVPRFVRRAVQLEAPVILVLGSRRRALRRAGYLTRTLIVRPRHERPRFVVPLDAPAAAAYALLSRIQGRGAGKRLAVRLALLALRAGAPLSHTITLGARDLGQPHLLASVLEAAGLDAESDWCLLTGRSDDLERLVWLCFESAGTGPVWAVKCSRVPGNDEPFDSEEAALHVLDALPPSLRHAPRVLGRKLVDGLPCAVETAATGQPLDVILPAIAHEEALDLIGTIADWLVELGRVTLRPPAELEPELNRLEEAVVPAWVGEGVQPGLALSLPSIPAVLQHNDLACSNILVGSGNFTVIDWQFSRPAGLPLWDLVCFLADALTTQKAPREAERERVVLSLLRGELDTSAFLFERVRDAADVLGVPRDAVGRVVALGWLHLGLRAAQRTKVGGGHRAAIRDPSKGWLLERLARPWLSDPSLGLTWSAFTGPR